MQGYNVRVSCLVLVLLVHNSVFSKPLETPPDGYVGTHSMNYLGSVQGKHYFYEHEPKRRWTEAKQACLDANMQMASVTSEIEAKFLTEIPHTVNYTSIHFWTAARDSQLVTQFMWDTHKTTVFNPGLQLDIYYTYQSCLYFMSQVALGKFVLSLCSLGGGTLCELNLGD